MALTTKKTTVKMRTEVVETYEVKKYLWELLKFSEFDNARTISKDLIIESEDVPNKIILLIGNRKTELDLSKKEIQDLIFANHS